nr:oxidoreductase [Raoultella sp. NCTC 9187]
MSVGYNLDGIKQPPMQQFIDNMIDAAFHPKFEQYRDTLSRWTHSDRFVIGNQLEDIRPQLETLAQRIPSRLVSGVTLSTMPRLSAR